MTVGTGTANNMMLAAGATLTVGGTDVGAMMGETVFTVEVERYHPELHGVKGELEGTGFVIRATPKMTVTMAETSYFQLSVLMDQLGSGSNATSRWYGSGTLGQLAAADYQAIIATGMSTCGSKSVKITLDQAYVSGSVSISLSDSEITSYEVEFTGTYNTNIASFPASVTIEI